MSTLTRVDALVAAAILDHDPERAPSWDGIAARLRDWADEQPQTEHEEGEMPSQDREAKRERDRIGGIKQAPSGVLSGPPAQGSNPSGGAMQIVPESGPHS